VYSATCQEATRDLFTANNEGAKTMSKGMNSRKQTKKAPAKTMKEKKAAKKAKKEANRSWR
jgi:ferredoxin